MKKGRKMGKRTKTATASASSSASSSSEKLTEDLIGEILVKLPVKSLLRFRCVCKTWCNLIKSPNFIDMHLKPQLDNSNNGDSIVIVGRVEGVAVLSIHCNETLSSTMPSPLEIPHLRSYSLEVCGPCNGLICISDDTNIVLCNPATREFKLLPGPLCANGEEFTRITIGFGYDYHLNDYKVVTFVDFYKKNMEHIIQIEIYKLSTNSWVEYDMKGYPELVKSPYCGTLYEGSFYWIAFDRCGICILSYDMSSDEFNFMPLPDQIFGRDLNNLSFIKVINDCLAVLVDKRDYENVHTVVDVWVMHEFLVTKSITKDFTIGPVNGLRDPITFWKNKALLLKSSVGKMISCALDTGEVKNIDIPVEVFAAVVYQESLVSIK